MEKRRGGYIKKHKPIWPPLPGVVQTNKHKNQTTQNQNTEIKNKGKQNKKKQNKRNKTNETLRAKSN